jgi:hypothetical protein
METFNYHYGQEFRFLDKNFTYTYLHTDNNLLYWNVNHIYGMSYINTHGQEWSDKLIATKYMIQIPKFINSNLKYHINNRIKDFKNLEFVIKKSKVNLHDDVKNIIIYFMGYANHYSKLRI